MAAPQYGYRQDVGTLRPARRLPDGRLVAEAHIAKAGVQEYADASYPGGMRRELRPDDEVFSPETLESYQNMPITPGHPPMLLTAANAKQYMVGSTGDRATRDEDHVKTGVMIADAATIKKMDAGDLAVSAGYACVIDPTSGVDPKYGRYDVIQRKIRGNHLAVAIPAGRAGPLARVRMDAELTSEERDNLSHREFAGPGDMLPINDAAHTRAAMARFNQSEFPDAAAKKTAYNKICAAAKKFGIDSTAFEKEYGGRFDAAANHLGGGAMDPEKAKEVIRVLESSLNEKTAEAAAHKERADEAETARDVERGKFQMLETEIAGLRVQIAAGATAVETEALVRERARADEAEKKVARFDEVRDTQVRERCALMLQGATVMGHDFRMDDMSDRDIKVAVIKRLDSTADVGNSVPDGIITGVFTQLLKGFKANARSQARVGAILEQTIAERPRNDSKEEKLKTFREQWKQPLPNDLRAARKES